MVHDEEGFLSPMIDENKCVKCGLCEKKCPQNTDVKKSDHSDYYAVVNANETDLKRSSSGGAFIVLARYVLSLGGKVCGCVYDAGMTAVHTLTEDISVVTRMCGSKYVQSEAFRSYDAIKEQLERGKYILFSGTACQTAALKTYLGRDYDRLICVDILCHGVPSPEFFKKYTSYLEHKHQAKITDISFRCKDRYGWGSEHRTRITALTRGREKYIYPYMPAYFCAFFYGINLMESCYKCKYAGSNRVSDITIGDYWGYYEKYHKRFPKGLSVLLANNEKGCSVIKNCKSYFSFCEELSETEGKGSNTNLYRPTHRYNSRDGFYIGVYEKTYKDFSRHIYLNKEIRNRLLKSLAGAAKCRVNRFIHLH